MKNLDVEIRDEVNEQAEFAFFNDLHIDLDVAIGRRENFDAIIERDAISVQDIDFFDVAIDKNSDENSEEITDDSIIDFDDTLSERSRTSSDVNIERDKIFDDVENEKITDRDDEKMRQKK
ncbi:hypothetical protein G7Y79_00046g082480 [Physcia stellaris]|nr:hypothetical protein G7Y79_00046g082480 [Physcia stellaris]